MSFTRHSPYESTAQDRFMGAILVFSIVLGAYFFSQGSFLGGVIDDRLRAHTTLTQSYGIQPGAEIKISGILVGHVETVELLEEAQVDVSIKLLSKYRELYRQGSQLKVNSSLGLDSVITGTGFEFIPGVKGQPAMSNGQKLDAVEPQSLDAMLEEWNIRDLAQKAEQIVNDLSTITATLAANQQQLVDSMNNMSEMTRASSELVKTLPPVINNIDNLVVKLDATLTDMGDEARGMSGDVGELLVSSKRLTQSLASVIDNIEPASEQLPTAVMQVNRVSRQTTQLLQKLNDHWLLGGAEPVSVQEPVLRYVGDNSIYTELGEPTHNHGN